MMKIRALRKGEVGDEKTVVYSIGPDGRLNRKVCRMAGELSEKDARAIESVEWGFDASGDLAPLGKSKDGE